MGADVLKEIQDFFAFLTSIITSFFNMFSGLFGGAKEEDSEPEATEAE